MRVFSTILIFSLFSSCNSSTQKNENKADQILEQLSSESGFSGAIHISSGQDILLSKGYGLCDRESELACTTESLFDIGSVTKQFTGAAILKLEESGLLATEDLVTDYFQNVPDDKKGITIHHLLTHSAGLADAIGDDYEEIEKEAFLARAMNSELQSTMGEAYNYSNVGYSLLAMIIEQRSGKDYDSYLREVLFKPLGMTNTGYIKDGTKVAVGYRGERVWGKPNIKSWRDEGPYWNLLGNGGILSTIEDLAKWNAALKSDDVLSSASKLKYFGRHIKEGDSPSHYGYGWAIFETPTKEKLIAHNGGNGFFFADFLMYEKSGLNVILLTNDASSVDESLAWEIARMERDPDYVYEVVKENDGQMGEELDADHKKFLDDFVSVVLSDDSESQKSFIESSYHSDLLSMADMETHYSMMPRFKEDFEIFDFSTARMHGSSIVISDGPLQLKIDLKDDKIVGIGLED